MTFRLQLDHRAGHGAVEGGAPLREQRRERHLLRERMPEPVFRHGVEALLLEELGRTRRSQRRHKVLVGTFADVLEDGLAKLPPDDSSRLEHVLVALAKAVDASCQHSLNCWWHPHLVQRTSEPIAPWDPLERSIVDEHPCDLLDEERVASGAIENGSADGRQRLVRADQLGQQLVDVVGRQGPQGDLLVIGVPHPARVELGPEVGERQRPGAG